MIDTISATVAGAALGFASSTPLGVINLWVADATLAGRQRTVWWFLAGVLVCDVAFAALAAWGYHTLLQDDTTTAWLEVVGGVLMVVMGVGGTQTRHPEQSEGPLQSERSFALLRMTKAGDTEFSATLLGVTLCGTNPAFLMFWVAAVGAISAEFGIEIAPSDVPLFALGVVVGDLIWFLFLMRLVRRGRDVLAPKSLNRIRSVIAWGFIALGVYVALQGAKTLLSV